MAALTLAGIRKSFGRTEVLHGIDLSVTAGEFVVFVGPSGCGKSTLLRLIAGLEDLTSGRIELDGALLNDVPPSQRGIAMVFQSYALYPHMSVFANMSFGLRLARMARIEIERRVSQAAEMLKIAPLLGRLPKALSGGQRQRVAIGRAVTRDPRLFLFDEPLSNLDAALRVATRSEIVRLKGRMPGTTMIYVTHDQVEAMTMADTIVVMNAGRIEQVGRPMSLYHSPMTPFVAGFIGSPGMNLFRGDVARSENCEVYGIRPEHVILSKAGGKWRGTVRQVERLGADAFVHAEVDGVGLLLARTQGEAPWSPGESIALTPMEGREHRFTGGRRVVHGAG